MYLRDNAFTRENPNDMKTAAKNKEQKNKTKGKFALLMKSVN